MKFRSPRFKRLHIIGAGRFVDGVLETDDAAAIEKIEAVAERYGVHAVRDASDPFDPSDYTVDVVNGYLSTADEAEQARVIAAETGGKARTGILDGPQAPRPVTAEA